MNAKVPSPVIDLSLSALIDEFVTLHESLKELEPLQKRHDELRRVLASHADAFGAVNVRLTGRLGYVAFSAPVSTRTLNSIPKFFTEVGLENFMECCSISIGRAEKLLDARQQSELFDVGLGARRLKDVGRISSVTLGNSGLTAVNR